MLHSSYLCANVYAQSASLQIQSVSFLAQQPQVYHFLLSRSLQTCENYCCAFFSLNIFQLLNGGEHKHSNLRSSENNRNLSVYLIYRISFFFHFLYFNIQYKRIQWRGIFFPEKQKRKMYAWIIYDAAFDFWEEADGSKINNCLVRATGHTLHSSKRYSLCSHFVSKSKSSVKFSCSDQGHGMSRLSYIPLYIQT